MDIVNQHFRQFYPPDWKSAWVGRDCAGTFGREYAGTGDRSARIFPEIACVDGFKMSVQGHWGAYSHPRDDFAESYQSFEVMTAPNAEPLLMERGGETNDEWSLYGYVPLETVLAVIEKHGGLKA